jgi:heat shock protein HslJ
LEKLMLVIRGSARNAALFIALLAVTGACGTTGAAPTPLQASGLSGTSWNLQSMGNEQGNGGGANLVFSDTTAGGFSGCNNFSTTYVATGQALVFGQFTSTQKACDAAANTFEQAYLAALGKTARYSMSGSELKLMDSAGTTLLTYQAGTSADLEGAWLVTGINNGAGAVSSVVSGSRVTMVFAQGLVAGNAGCNRYNGGYSTDGQSIAIGPLMSTRMACPDQAITAQEAQFLTALSAADTWQVSGNQLTLTGDGANQVMAVSGPLGQ